VNQQPVHDEIKFQEQVQLNPIQNCGQKVFSREGLRLDRGLDILKFDKNYLFIEFRTCIEAFFRRLSPPTPSRGDGRGFPRAGNSVFGFTAHCFWGSRFICRSCVCL